MVPTMSGETVLSARGRTLRMIAVGAILAALLTGTFFGNDDSFPFGPFRMYSVANRTSGNITATQLEGLTEGGVRVDIDFARFGLRRAEVEGQLDSFVADPDRLGLLVEAYENRNPDGPELAELYLVQEVHQLERGRPVETTETTLATWRGS
jgi:hypothetical protein